MPRPGRLTRTLEAFIRERDRETCQICLQRDGPLEIDHIIPIAAGGTTTPENLRLVCRAFNRGGRCPALGPYNRYGKPRKRPAFNPEPGRPPTSAVLTVEVQISRQYTFHQLQLANESEPTYHRWLYQAFEAAAAANVPTLTILCGETQYQLDLTSGVR